MMEQIISGVLVQQKDQVLKDKKDKKVHKEEQVDQVVQDLKVKKVNHQ